MFYYMIVYSNSILYLKFNVKGLIDENTKTDNKLANKWKLNKKKLYFV